MSSKKYTDNSVVDLGGGHSLNLNEISVIKLLRKYRKHKKKTSNINQEFITYVKSNLQRFYDEAEASGNISVMDSIKGLGFIPMEKTREELLAEICSKEIYTSKKAANTALVKIKDSEQTNKKPVRSYECDECSFWHLTSIPLSVWKEKMK